MEHSEYHGAPPLTHTAERQEALRRYHVLDTPPEKNFDQVTRLVAQIADVPTALITLIDEERQWFKSCFGYDRRQTDIEVSFCAHAVHERETLVVEDATQDPRFKDNPLVTGEGGWRFYAGAPLKTPEGIHVGTLCIVDYEPRVFDAAQRAVLEDLADVVIGQFELRSAEAQYRKLFQGNPQPTFIYDVDTLGLLDANAAAERTYGYAAHELKGLALADLVAPASLEAHTDRSTDGSAPFTARHRRQDGTHLSVEVREESLLYQGRQARVATMIDVADRTRGRQYERLVENMQEVVFETDLDGKATFLNSAWEEITGFSVEEVLGDSLLHYVHPKERVESLQAFAPLLQRRQDLFRHRARFLTRSGAEQLMQFRARLITGDDGTPVGTVGTLTPVEEGAPADAPAPQEAPADSTIGEAPVDETTTETATDDATPPKAPADEPQVPTNAVPAPAFETEEAPEAAHEAEPDLDAAETSASDADAETFPLPEDAEIPAAHDEDVAAAPPFAETPEAEAPVEEAPVEEQPAPFNDELDREDDALDDELFAGLDSDETPAPQAHTPEATGEEAADEEAAYEKAAFLDEAPEAPAEEEHVEDDPLADELFAEKDSTAPTDEAAGTFAGEEAFADEDVFPVDEDDASSSDDDLPFPETEHATDAAPSSPEAELFGEGKEEREETAPLPDGDAPATQETPASSEEASLSEDFPALETLEGDTTFAGGETLDDVRERLSTDPPQLRTESLDFSEHLRTTLDELEPAARRKGLMMHRALPERTARMETDPGALRLLIAALVNNAIASTDEGSITVSGRVEEGDDEVSLRVVDTGADISKSLLNSLLNVALGDDEDDEEEARERHLAFVHRLVNLMQGSVEMESERGRGTVFTVALPCRPDHDDAHEAATAEATLPRKEAASPGGDGSSPAGKDGADDWSAWGTSDWDRPEAPSPNAGEETVAEETVAEEAAAQESAAAEPATEADDRSDIPSDTLDSIFSTSPDTGEEEDDPDAFRSDPDSPFSF